MAKKSMMGTGAGTALLGSLAYLYIAFTWTGSAAWFGGMASFAWFLVPLAAATAIISAVSLFLLSASAITWKNYDDKIVWASRKAAWWGGFSLILLTGGSGTWTFWLAVVGFVFAYFGTGMESM